MFSRNFTSMPRIPSLVGNHYFCESGCLDAFIQERFCSSDLLRDRKQLMIETDCCENFSVTWFHRFLLFIILSITNEFIKIWVCCD